MKVTKLHLLLFFIFSSLAYYGYYFWNIKQKEIREQEEKSKIALAMKIKEEETSAKRMAELLELQKSTAVAEIEQHEPLSVTYTVEKGDTLWKISKKKEHFGAGRRWYDIWKANEGTVQDFDKIEVGQSLTIPIDKPEGYLWNKTSEKRKKRLVRYVKPQKAELTN